MKILIASYTYTPVLSPRSFRWSQIAKEWVNRGHQVDVVAGRCDGAPQHETLDGVGVHRCGSQWLARLRDSRRASAGGSTAAVQQRSSRGATLRRWLRPAYDLTWKNVWWPDHACLWYRPGRKTALRLMRERTYDAVVSVSNPFTSHLVGWSLARRFPHSPWLIDVGDPFCFAREMPLNNFRLFGWLNRTIERRVFEAATAVAVTNDTTRRRYTAALGEAATRRMHVVGPVIGDDWLRPENAAAGRRNRRDHLDVVFAGNLINPVRRPGSFFATLARVSSAWESGDRPPLVFHLLGDPAEAVRPLVKEVGLGDNQVQFHGRLEQRAAMSLVRGADVLLNCGNVTDYQLPSKLFEYMATGKPIVNLVFHPHDPSIAALSRYPLSYHHHVASSPIEGLTDFLAAQATRTDNEPAPKYLREHQAPAIAAQYEELLC